jgi:hypothetical protein
MLSTVSALQAIDGVSGSLTVVRFLGGVAQASNASAGRFS